MRKRFYQMRDSARVAGKVIPTYAQLEAAVPADMRCPACGKQMHWTGPPRSNVISLQHWHDGSIGFLCFSCNSAHGHSANPDALLNTPEGQRWCGRCETYKPLGDFHSGTGRSRAYCCRACDSIRQRNLRLEEYL